MVGVNRRILAVVSDASRSEQILRALRPKGFWVTMCVGARQLEAAVRSADPKTVVIDYDPLSWAQHRDSISDVLRGRDVVVVARNYKQRGANFAGLSPRGIVVGMPTWDGLSMWLQAPDTADPNRATYSEASAMG